MDRRKQQLLQLIVENYISSADPVGSKILVEKGNLNISGATIRNEMREMEEKGYLTHPHTSAGRIPTEEGYRYYVENLMKPSIISKKTKEILLSLKKGEENNFNKIKKSGKHVSETTNNAVIISSGSDRIYYTGFSNLFAEPEFRNYAHVVDFSSIFDQCEDIVEDIFNSIQNKEVKVLMGKDNPLCRTCGAVVSKIKDNFLFIILGPMRMNYNKNFSLVSYISSIFNY